MGEQVLEGGSQRKESQARRGVSLSSSETQIRHVQAG